MKNSGGRLIHTTSPGKLICYSLNANEPSTNVLFVSLCLSLKGLVTDLKSTINRYVKLKHCIPLISVW